MKQLTQQDLIELAKYIDDELSPKEREGLERRLATNELLQQKLTALLDVHQLMKSDTLPVPSRNFTQRVMENLDHYTPPVISFSITNGILLLIGVLIAGALALYLVRSGVFDGSVTVANPLHLSITENLFQQSLPAISFNGKMVVNTIVLLNLALGWVVLDRTILRPWFRRRTAGSH